MTNLPLVTSPHYTQDIRILNKESKRWESGQVVNKASTPRSYNIRTYTGSTLCRYRIDLCERIGGEETSTYKAPTQQQPCGPKEIPAPDKSTSAGIQSSSVPQEPLDSPIRCLWQRALPHATPHHLAGN